VKGFALSNLKADLVGVANIERFANAPLRMSPQGIMPTARSVVVMAIHHTDACVELGGVQHPQIIGPYRVQYWMNSRLDEMSYRMGLFLENEGYAAVPIVSSNIWRYKGYKDLTAHFAPDMSHIYASVAAGLSELGYSGIAITPEFGARQRYISVITDAPLEPTPLLEPGSVCDKCNLCVKNCRAHALSKELDGLKYIEIEGKRYASAKKNLWRCAWGEHFNLDLDLPIPERVDEEVILDAVRKHGMRGGEMGSCLRYCVPKALRYFDKEYTNAPRRKRNAPAEGQPTRALEGRLRALAVGQGVDSTLVTSASDLTAMGIDVKKYLPDGATVMTLGVQFRSPEGEDRTGSARNYLLETAAFDVAREIQRHGYSAVCCTDLPVKTIQATIKGLRPGWAIQTTAVVTSAPLTPTSRTLSSPAAPKMSPAETKNRLKRLLSELGADLVGVAPAERIAALKPQVAAIFDGMEVLVAKDKSKIFTPYEPEIQSWRLRALGPEDHLRGAKSVVVVGLRLPRASVERTALPPAEAVGPYAFAQYESVALLRLMGFRAMRWLEDHGFRATLTFDLTGAASFVGNPRGEQHDAFSNRFEAVAAGLGRLSKAGFVVTPEFGANVRFVAIVTDAEMPGDPVQKALPQLKQCGTCRRCLDACKTRAFGRKVSVKVDGATERFHLHDIVRCDWAKRYSLVGEEGVNFVGWHLKLPVPDKIDAQALDAGLRQQPPIPKYRPCNFEACVLACPLVRS
jgi:epoxyqueuosine reductase QueG